jgi:hypothetical protein
VPTNLEEPSRLAGLQQRATRAGSWPNVSGPLSSPPHVIVACLAVRATPSKKFRNGRLSRLSFQACWPPQSARFCFRHCNRVSRGPILASGLLGWWPRWKKKAETSGAARPKSFRHLPPLLDGPRSMLASMNLPTGRPPSPQIRTRDTSLDGTTNGSAGANSATNVNAGVNSATHLGGQRCGDHEGPGDSHKYRKLAKHKTATCPIPVRQPS